MEPLFYSWKSFQFSPLSILLAACSLYMAFMFFLYMKIFLFQLGELLAFLQGRYTGDELPQRLFGKVFISRSYLKDNFAI